MNIQDAIKSSRKIVIKIGSNTLALPDGTQNTQFMASFAKQCKNLIDQGKQLVIVSSGAQVSGVSTLKEWARKKDLHFRQALCAIGQVELMAQWRKAFNEQGLHIGQILLTKEDFEDNNRSLNIRNTLLHLQTKALFQSSTKTTPFLPSNFQSATTTTLRRSHQFSGAQTF